MEPNSRF